MSLQPTVHIEAFEWTFEKPRIFVLGDLDDSLGIFSRIQHDLLFRGRRILVLTGQDNLKPFSKMRVFQQSWDLVIHIRTNIDYSILASYIQNVPKPVSVLWIGSEVPPVLLQKYESGVYWICWNGQLPVGRDLNYVFISPSLPPFKYKDWFLAQHPTQAQALLANLEDLREKKAGIVFCSRDHSVKWYDAVGLEGGSEEVNLHDVRDILKWCTEQLSFIDS